VAIDRKFPLLLASASPRRRELLASAGVPLEVCAVDVDEAVKPGESADAYLQRIVSDKLAAACGKPQAANCAAVLVADTSVVDGTTIMGKPADDDDARRMLSALAGREHRVMTRFAIEGDGLEHAQTVTTKVWFRQLSAADIDRYVATGECRDKAGAYAIQGIGAMLVSRIDGSYTNVVGLPLAEVVVTLQRADLLGPVPL
jgi:septum formation protein